MSTPICVYARTGRPLIPNEVAILLAAVAQQGPDGRGVWCQGEVGLGYLALHETPEMADETQPAALDPRIDASAPRDLIISADARLDNRTELAASLQIPHHLLASLGDSQLLLAAYRRWGEASPSHLLGDFAFVIWDGPQHKIFCCRDPLGVKPLYTYIKPELFLAAGDVRALVAHPQGPHQPNQQALGYYLRETQYFDSTTTYLEGVEALAPAHTLTVSAHKVALRRYWFPDQLPDLSMTSLDAAAEELRALLEDAVRVRLRRVHAVGAHLSGGLDSSAIAVLAARHVRAEGAALSTYSWQPTTTDPALLGTPEYDHLRQVVDQENFDHIAVNVCADDVARQLQRDITLHHSQNYWYEPLVRQSASTRHVRVLLSGWGGDELISFNGRAYLAELFWRRQWVTLARRIWSSSAFVGPNRLRHSLGILRREVIEPSLPNALRSLLVTPRSKNLPQTSPYMAYLSLEFGAMVAQLPVVPPFRRYTRVRAYQLALLNSGHLHKRMEGWAAEGADDHMVYRYPLLDRRIVEFALSLPSVAFGKQRGGRYLFRRAVANLLPHDVCWGNAKFEPQRVHMLSQVTKAALPVALAAIVNRVPVPPRLQIDPLRRALATAFAEEHDEVHHTGSLVRAVQVLGAGWQLAQHVNTSTELDKLSTTHVATECESPPHA